MNFLVISERSRPLAKYLYYPTVIAVIRRQPFAIVLGSMKMTISKMVSKVMMLLTAVSIGAIFHQHSHAFDNGYGYGGGGVFNQGGMVAISSWWAGDLLPPMDAATRHFLILTADYGWGPQEITAVLNGLLDGPTPTNIWFVVLDNGDSTFDIWTFEYDGEGNFHPIVGDWDGDGLDDLGAHTVGPEFVLMLKLRWLRE